MELAKYKACICEGSAENAIMDILLDHDLLIFDREEMLEEEVIRCREGKKFEDSSTGNGAVDAVIKAIERITKRKGTLKGYSVNAASEGKDALGEVTVHVDFGQPKPIVGKGASTDVIEASARAYLNAVNRSIRMENMPRPNNLDSGTI